MELVADAAIGVLGLEADFLGEFGETGPGVVLLEAAAAAGTLIGGAIGALVGGSPEGHELIEAVAHAGESAGKTFDEANGVASVVALLGVPAEDGNGQLFDAVNDVAEGAAKLAGGRVLRRRGRLNVGIRRADHSEKKC